MRLRFATPEDADAIAAYHTRAWQVGYRGLIDQDGLDALDPADRAESTRNWLQPENVEKNHLTFVVAE
ncbi:MAG: hypothetical protein HKN26_09695, partial [Acidimicrobiales bacterium]|nr:hypothetical protein [Acidimicrobiales bacterium]